MSIECVAERTLLNALWWPGREGRSKGRGYTYIYGWFTFLYSRNTALWSNSTPIKINLKKVIANILIKFSLLFLVGISLDPFWFVKKRLNSVPHQRCQEVTYISQGCSAWLETEVGFEPRSIWLQILSPWVHSFMSLPPSSMAATNWSQLRSLPSVCFPFMEHEQILFFFQNSFHVPHSFIKTGRNAYCMQSDAIGIGLILPREREALEETDPRIHSQTRGQRCSKKVPTVFMFIFLFFLFLLAAPYLMQNLISPSRSQTCAPSSEA